MTDKAFEQLRKAHFLQWWEAECLVNDIKDEYLIVELDNESKRPIFAWHLRYFHYLPYSAISKLLGYSSSWAAADSVKTFMNSDSVISTVSMSGNDTVEILRKLSSDFYECKHNVYMDRLNDDNMKEALLLMASQKCGYVDRPSKTGWFSYTPKDSTMLNAFNIKLEELTITEISNDYEIKRVS
jgi:hypothetical protein